MYETSRNQAIGAIAGGSYGAPKQSVLEDPSHRTIAENLDRKMQLCMNEYERLKAIKAKLGGKPLLELTIGELRQAMDY